MKALFKLVGVVGFACLSCGALRATQYLVAIQAENGQYLCAENGGGSTVVANRNNVGSWETFVIDDSVGSGNGWYLSIKSTENPKFLCWNNQQSTITPYSTFVYTSNPSLVINRDYVGSWETFGFVDPWGAGASAILGNGWVNTKILTRTDIYNPHSPYQYLGSYPGTYLRAANGGGSSMDGFGGDQPSTNFISSQLRGWTGTRFYITVLAVLP